MKLLQFTQPLVFSERTENPLPLRIKDHAVNLILKERLEFTKQLAQPDRISIKRTGIHLWEIVFIKIIGRLGVSLRNAVQFSVGLLTLPFFLNTPELKEALYYTALNFIEMLIHLGAAVLSVVDLISHIVIRLPAVIIHNMSVSQDYRPIGNGASTGAAAVAATSEPTPALGAQATTRSTPTHNPTQNKGSVACP